MQIKDGKYYLTPGSGNEVSIVLKIILKNNTTIFEKHKFRIKSVGRFVGLINGFNCSKCVVEMTKDELETVIISTKTEDFLVDIEPHYFNVNYFEATFSNGKTIKVNGNKINIDVMNQIYRLEKGSYFYIDRILNYFAGGGLYEKAVPIKIMIVE